MSDTLTALDPSSPVAEKALYGLADWTVVGTATGASTATVTARAQSASTNGVETAAYQIAPTRAYLSFGATITSACTFTVKDGTTVIFQAEIPTATNPLPIPFDLRGLRSSAGAALTAAVSSPGSITATITMWGKYFRAA
jgi:hypothetical protein